MAEQQPAHQDGEELFSFSYPCLCKKVKLALEGAVRKASGLCHCFECRSVSSGVLVEVYAFANGSIKVTDGSDHVKSFGDFKDGRRMVRYFCDTCFTQVYNNNKPDWELINGQLLRYDLMRFGAAELPPDLAKLHPLPHVFEKECVVKEAEEGAPAEAKGGSSEIEVPCACKDNPVCVVLRGEPSAACFDHGAAARILFQGAVSEHVIFAADHVTVVGGADKVGEFTIEGEGHGMKRSACKSCGQVLLGTDEQGGHVPVSNQLVRMALGGDDKLPRAYMPTEHVHYDERIFEAKNTLPKHEEE